MKRPAIPAHYLEVRCCCTPQKLLGYLPIGPGQVPRVGLRARWHLGRGEFLDLRIEEWQESEIKLEADGREVEERRGGLAFYSEETPLEVLRQVPGFVEAR